MFEILKTLLAPVGPTGAEHTVADAIKPLIKPYVNSFETDVMGNLIAVKEGKPGGKRIMISAHMDHIGFVVTDIEKEGFLRVMPLGGINIHVSLARRVSFANGVQGVLVSQPVPEGETQAMKHLFIDIGAESREEAIKMVNIGDAAVYNGEAFRLGKNRVSAPAMDDRCACALLVSLLQTVKDTNNTMIAVFSTQEEVGCRGAHTAAFAKEPDLGVALDVTLWGDTPETKIPALKLGQGPAVKIMDRASISSPVVRDALFLAAQKAGVSAQREVLPFGGTDAGAMQQARGGLPVGTVSIPCRYVHTACETIDMRDMDGALKVLAEFVNMKF